LLLLLLLLLLSTERNVNTRVVCDYERDSEGRQTVDLVAVVVAVVVVVIVIVVVVTVSSPEWSEVDD
ncbi:hypothetical protein GQ42DRAFT_165083, partial [Ramicandelaber brevisporus]